MAQPYPANCYHTVKYFKKLLWLIWNNKLKLCGSSTEPAFAKIHVHVITMYAKRLKKIFFS